MQCEHCTACVVLRINQWVRGQTSAQQCVEHGYTGTNMTRSSGGYDLGQGNAHGESGETAATQIVQSAWRHHQAGRLNEARSLYEKVLAQAPRHGHCLHMLGALHYQTGRPDLAVDFMTRAVDEIPRSPGLYTHLGEALRAVGNYEDAIDACRRALDLKEVLPDALNTLGASLNALGKRDEAVDALETAIEFQPDNAEAHANLGNAWRGRGDYDRAVAAYERAIEINPKFAGAISALGMTFQAQGQPEKAVANFQRVVELDPNDAITYSNLGAALRSLGKTDDAVMCLRKSIAIRPEFAAGHTNLGMALLARGDLDEAVGCYQTGLELKRGISTGPSSHESAGQREQYNTYRFTAAHKLRHDIEQFEYLDSRGLLPSSPITEIDAYKSVLAEVIASHPDGAVVRLNSSQRSEIGDTYNRLIHIADAPAMSDNPINGELDHAAIEADFHGNAPGLTVVDDLLAGDAFEALRRFCLESTIWYDFNYRGGYLGAYLSEGFGCGLLFQIVESLRQGLPGIFGDHKLRQMWAYKYDSTMRAIPTHADAAAINVNFWITPDDANLDPDSGGLVVYKREAPSEWDFDKYNKDHESIAAFLETSDSVTIPYRQNRAVIFNSNLFHKSDDFRFKEGYENRRINVTILFGFRS